MTEVVINKKSELLETINFIKNENQSDYETRLNMEMLISIFPDNILENSSIVLEDNGALTLYIKNGHFTIKHNVYKLYITIDSYTYEKTGYVDNLEQLLEHIKPLVN